MDRTDENANIICCNDCEKPIRKEWVDEDGSVYSWQKLEWDGIDRSRYCKDCFQNHPEEWKRLGYVDFTLVQRYRVIYNDGTQEELDITPETCYYFDSQETKYLASKIKRLERFEDIKEIQKFFVKIKTKPYRISIGV